MADFAHSKKVKGLDVDGLKVWVHPINQQHYLAEHEDDYWNYDLDDVSIDKLIADNKLDDPQTYREYYDGVEVDPTKFVYDQKRAAPRNHIITGTFKPDGTIRLNDGRHRVRALKNAGYTHVKIPVTNELINDHETLREDYYKIKDPKVLRDIARALPYIEGHDQKLNKIYKDLLFAKAKYLESKR